MHHTCRAVRRSAGSGAEDEAASDCGGGGRRAAPAQGGALLEAGGGGGGGGGQWCAGRAARRSPPSALCPRLLLARATGSSPRPTGADVDSDHNLLVMNCRLKQKKLQKGRNLRRWDLDKLKEPEVVQSFRESIREQLTGLGERNIVEEEWVALRDEVVKAAEDQVGKKTRSSRNPWVTEEILNLVDERRKYKNAVNEAGREEYKRLKNEIDRKCKMAKQGWLEDKCKGVEAYLTRGKIDTAYRKIKETFGEKRTTCMNIKSSDGNPVLSKEGKAERWKEYIEGLYKGDVFEDNIMEMEEDVDEDEMGDMILREEFDRALKGLSRNKTPGVDKIPLELLTALGEPVLTKLYHLGAAVKGGAVGVAALRDGSCRSSQNRSPWNSPNDRLAVRREAGWLHARRGGSEQVARLQTVFRLERRWGRAVVRCFPELGP
ncbi:uncharacterized protein LOC126191130 [Schistocerca cancellata]|uniref:uncharacterized protein LOC126191130 n=1 Tax=Schistocerca cancellata TaxID=274614 RepID=UPI002118B181|nr:uncharacterized protein LOC126191130 [Schistocerca cancellata]